MRNKKLPIGISVAGYLLLIAGCGPLQTFEADYKYDVIKKAADDSVEVVDKGKSERSGVGDAGGAESPGIGMIRTGIQKLNKEDATIKVTYPDGTGGTLELHPKETKELWHKGDDYGVRVTLTEIRSR